MNDFQGLVGEGNRSDSLVGMRLHLGSYISADILNATDS